MATSYTSEHSAEYSLVPALKKILHEEYSHVAPVFPWISREFSKLSRHLHKDDLFHVLVLFPRRPKFNDQKTEEIYITINLELDVFKNAGEIKGVPMIAGCPRAVDIWDLSNCQNYAWLDLTKNNHHEYLIPISKAEKKRYLLEKEDILALVRNSAIFNFRDFEDFFRDAKRNQPKRMYGSQYKPVYFLIKTR